MELGRLDEALSARQEQKIIHQSVGRTDKVIVALFGEAMIYELKGMLREALTKNEEACDLARRSGDVNMIPVMQTQARELRARLGLDRDKNPPNPLRLFRIATSFIELGISFAVASLVARQLINIAPLIYSYSAIAIGIGIIVFIIGAIRQRQWPENEGIKDVFWLVFIGGFWGAMLGPMLRIMPVGTLAFIFYGYVLLFLFMMFRKS